MIEPCPSGHLSSTRRAGHSSRCPVAAFPYGAPEAFGSRSFYGTPDCRQFTDLVECVNISNVEAELRRWTRNDSAALYRAASSSPDLSTQLGETQLDTMTACTDFIDRYLSAQGPDTHNFAIAVDGEAVGNVGLSSIERYHDTAWASYWVALPHRRRGLATRGLATMARWAFQELGLFRLELGHRVINPASCAVAVAAGFAAEGVERAKLRYGDQRFDVEIDARLTTDPTPTVSLLHFAMPG